MLVAGMGGAALLNRGDVYCVRAETGEEGYCPTAQGIDPSAGIYTLTVLVGYAL
jgi:hypothetical protein